MDESGTARSGLDFEKTNDKGLLNCHEPSVSLQVPNFFRTPLFPTLAAWIDQKIKDHRKVEETRFGKIKEEGTTIDTTSERENESSDYLYRNQDKQLQAWRDNPSWIDQPPVMKVNTQKSSFCHLNVEVNVGMPPDVVYDIFTHPDNKRYFRNIKENISRRVLIDEGARQLVEVEQAAAWKFLWWSGTFPIQLLVDQNRKDFSSKYKQGKTRFMNVFEGSWRVEPLFVDEHLCEARKPKTQEEYYCCSGGRGRIGSRVIMDQRFQPAALLTPPPISWYVRGITVKTTESMIEDLLAEAARIRQGIDRGESLTEDDDPGVSVASKRSLDEDFESTKTAGDIKNRWKSRRKKAKK